MNDIESIFSILTKIDCRPYNLKMDCISCVRLGYSVFSTPDNVHTHEDHVLYLQARLFRRDTASGQRDWGQGAKYFLSPHMSTSEILRVALKACLTYAEHEVRETFKYQNKRIFGPHISASSLLVAADDMELRA